MLPAVALQCEKPAAVSLLDLGRAVWILAATVVLVYVLTLAIFPGVLAEDVSNSALGSWCAPNPAPSPGSQQRCVACACHAGVICPPTSCGHSPLSCHVSPAFLCIACGLDQVSGHVHERVTPPGGIHHAMSHGLA